MKTKKKKELGALQKLAKRKNREQARVDKLGRTIASKEMLLKRDSAAPKTLKELKEQETELIRQKKVKNTGLRKRGSSASLGKG